MIELDKLKEKKNLLTQEYNKNLSEIQKEFDKYAEENSKYKYDDEVEYRGHIFVVKEWFYDDNIDEIYLYCDVVLTNNEIKNVMSKVYILEKKIKKHE